MTDNPTWTQTWSGSDNTWRVWATRLNSRLVNLLQDNTAPVLIVHGADDYDSTPVASARVLVESLEAAGNTHFEYWEIPCMGHGWSSLPAEQGSAVEAGMLDWLLGRAVAEDGPPRFAQSEAEPCPVVEPG
jgi:pimeloyl-ACP methyl ester carboxylesterase